MIVEKFFEDKVKILYERFAEKGRMLPTGVAYINSWITEDVKVCYQLMEAENEAQLHAWIANWSDVASFEIFAVISSAQAKEKVFANNF